MANDSMNPLYILHKDQLYALNTLASFLALTDFPEGIPLASNIDIIILPGHAVLPNIEACFKLALSQNVPLLIAGGIGHSTYFLQKAVAEHPVYHTLTTQEKPEAVILKELAIQFFGLKEHQIFIEDQSRNSGENAAFSQKLLDVHHIDPKNILLIQDPTLQRRTDATFRHVWRNRSFIPRFLNWPVLIPQLQQNGDSLSYIGQQITGLWPIERFISLVIGELPRLRDNSEGYGPQGSNFITHVDIPENVENAYQILMHTHPLSSELICRI